MSSWWAIQLCVETLWRNIFNIPRFLQVHSWKIRSWQKSRKNAVVKCALFIVITKGGRRRGSRLWLFLKATTMRPQVRDKNRAKILILRDHWQEGLREQVLFALYFWFTHFISIYLFTFDLLIYFWTTYLCTYYLLVYLLTFDCLFSCFFVKNLLNIWITLRTKNSLRSE